MTTAQQIELKKFARQTVREALDSEIERLRKIARLRRSIAGIPADDATPEEIRAIKQGRKEFARGAYAPLSTVLHDLDNSHRARRAKKSKKVSA